MESIYKLYRENDAWLQRSGHVTAVWGIFNPNGPTVYCVGSTHSSEPRVQEVFMRWMNPFAQGSYGLGRVDASEEDATAVHALALKNAARPRSTFLPEGYGLFKSIPSFVFLPAPGPLRVALEEMIQIGLAARQDDWGYELYYLRKYGDRLFDRAGEEVREALEQEMTRANAKDEEVQRYFQYMRLRHAHIASFRDWTPVQYDHYSYNAQAFDEWLETLTTEDFNTHALIQLAQAWAGSIDFVRDGKVPVKLTFEDLNRFLHHFGWALWPEDWTSEKILQRQP